MSSPKTCYFVHSWCIQVPCFFQITVLSRTLAHFSRSPRLGCTLWKATTEFLLGSSRANFTERYISVSYFFTCDGYIFNVMSATTSGGAYILINTFQFTWSNSDDKLFPICSSNSASGFSFAYGFKHLMHFLKPNLFVTPEWIHAQVINSSLVNFHKASPSYIQPIYRLIRTWFSYFMCAQFVYTPHVNNISTYGDN